MQDGLARCMGTGQSTQNCSRAPTVSICAMLLLSKPQINPQAPPERGVVFYHRAAFPKAVLHHEPEKSLPPRPTKLGLRDQKDDYTYKSFLSQSQEFPQVPRA